MIGFDLQRGGAGVWFETWRRLVTVEAVPLRAQRRPETALATIAFLSNYLNGRFYLPVLFVYSVEQFLIFVLHTVYLSGQRARERKARPSYSRQHKNENKTTDNEFNKWQLMFYTITSLKPC